MHCLLWLLMPSCPVCVVPAITVPWLLGGPGLSHLMLLCFPPRAALDMAPCHSWAYSLGQPFLPLILRLAWPRTTAFSAQLPLLSLLGTLFLPHSLRSQSLPSTVLASALCVRSSWLSLG